MAVVKQTRVWNGLTVDSFTNTDTGSIEIKTQPRTGGMGSTIEGVTLAESGPDGKWKMDQPAYFRRQYNAELKKQGKQPLNEKEFQTAFYADGANKFNNDRAAALNNPDNYKNKTEYQEKTAAHAESGVPLVKNAETGETNNSKGENSGNNVDAAQKDGAFKLEEYNTPDEGKYAAKHTTTNYRYPIGTLPDLGYDFVQFSAFKYDPKGGGENTGGALDSSFFGERRETVTLPIMPSIEDTSMTDWGRDTMNFLQKAGADIATSVLGNLSEGDDIGAALTDSIADTKEIASQFLGNPQLKNAIVGYFAKQATGVNVLARNQGTVINPNLELLFKGPSLRQFNFNFKLRPRGEAEAAVCRNIIRSFKKNMNPRRTPGHIFLNTPSVFKIDYKFNGAEHPSMNRIKMCALTSFKVNYTPDGSYMTYGDGQVTGYDISLTFGEIFPIYADNQDLAEAVSGVGY